MKYLEAACLILVTAVLVFLLGEGGLLLREVRLKTVPQITQAATDADRSAIIVGATVTNIEKGTRQWQTEQTNLTIQAEAGLAALNSDLGQVGKLASTATLAISTQSNSLISLEDKATASMNNLDTSLQAPMRNFADASLQLSLASKTFAQGLSVTIPNLEQTAQASAGTADNVEATTKDVKDFVHRETAPVRGTWNVIKQFLFEIAGPAASVATAAR
jgi:ABC-type transporter Mla subunit MlaD